MFIKEITGYITTTDFYSLLYFYTKNHYKETYHLSLNEWTQYFYNVHLIYIHYKNIQKLNVIVIGLVIFFIKRKKSNKSSTEENEVDDQ